MFNSILIIFPIYVIVIPYIANCAFHPKLSGGLVLSVQWDCRVRNLGIITCCPTLWFRASATLKLYRFRWRIKTLQEKRNSWKLCYLYMVTNACSYSIKSTSPSTTTAQNRHCSLLCKLSVSCKQVCKEQLYSLKKINK